MNIECGVLACCVCGICVVLVCVVHVCMSACVCRRICCQIIQLQDIFSLRNSVTSNKFIFLSLPRHSVERIQQFILHFAAIGQPVCASDCVLFAIAAATDTGKHVVKLTRKLRPHEKKTP